MLFPTVQFAVFFVVVLTVNWLLMRNRVWWKVAMLTASYIFYAAWDWRFVFLIVLSTIANQAAATAMSGQVDEARRAPNATTSARPSRSSLVARFDV